MSKPVVSRAEPSPAECHQLVALYNARRYAELEHRARTVTGQYPASGFAWKLLGAAQQMQGKNALAAFQKTAELMPGDAEAHFNLGVVQRGLGLLNEAAGSYRRALKINGAYAEAHGNLGNVLKDLGQRDEAVASLRRALQIRPDSADAHNNLGTVLKDLGQFEAAAASYRRAVALRPDHADAFYNLGNALKDLGRLEEAAAAYRRATELRPAFADAYNNLGFALKELDQLEDAAESYRRALQSRPDFAEAHSNLGTVLKELGRLDEAAASYRSALAIQRLAFQHAVSAHLLLPIIPESAASIAAWRERYRNGIATLMDTPGILEEPGEKLGNLSFYLAYHNADDRPLMEALCRLFRARAPDLAYTAPHVPGWRSPAAQGRRIRVGFLSEYLYGHTIGKHYQGYIRHLDRTRFEVVVIHAPKSKRDDFRQKLDALADKAIILPAGLKKQQQAVAAEQLDVLFYPDIGMNSATYFLAYARLAPVQATSWGHPDTTGLDTMDYYVAAVSNEAQDAGANYSERLVRLNRLPCFYYRTPASSIPNLSRTELGLPETGTLYGCPQNLFKLHPDFDAVLAEIAEGDPAGHLILPEGKHGAWTAQLKARWARTFPHLTERAVFLPRMSWERFMAVMAQTDVLLDPLHFGSGNTLYDAMVFGTPVVTWPGRFGRGRNVAAAYQQMGLEDAPVVQRLEDYAPLALALGRDPERSRALREASLQASERELFEDMRAVREFESFLENAVESHSLDLNTRMPNTRSPSNEI